MSMNFLNFLLEIASHKIGDEMELCMIFFDS